MRAGRLVIAAAGLGLVAASLTGATGGARAADATCDWPMFGHDAGRSFASPDGCSTISTSTAPTLRPKWFFNTSSPVTAQPTVVDAVVYVGTFDGTFYAVDAAGSKRWTFDIKAYDNDVTDYGRISDSAAVARVGLGSSTHKVVVFGGGDTLFALDASDASGGTLLDHQCVDRVDPTCGGSSGFTSEIESSPAIVPQSDGTALVLVGTDVNEHDPSGPAGLIEFSLGTDGRLTPRWQFDPETGTTYSGLAPLEKTPTEHGCGDVWSSPMVYGGTVVFGTGNCNHPTAGQVESTFAVDLAGNLLWRAHPHAAANGLDLDFGATPNSLGSGYAGEGGKDGVYYSYRPDGTLAWSTQVATGSDIGGMIASTAFGHLGGSHHNDPAIFAATAIPVSSIDPPGSLQNDVQSPNQAFGVHAIDAATHQVVWDAPSGAAYGAAVYAGGVVFVPDTFTDSLVALDADTGAVLRAQPLNAPPSSPVAVVGNSVYMGSGTTESSPPLNTLSSFGGIWAFQTGP